MTALPTVIASSVIRSAQQGESHGGVYIVDLSSGKFRQVIDWNDPGISWEGRGWDRGLRGIAFYGERVYLAASDEIFVYSPTFQLIESFRNPYLKHCHEIFIHEDRLYLTSTGFDSILEFDLSKKTFSRGYFVQKAQNGSYTLVPYDPNTSEGPQASMECHINHVFWQNGTLFVSGTKLNTLLAVNKGVVESYAVLPYTTHNARPYREGVLCHDTANDRVAYFDRSGRLIEGFPIVRYPQEQLTWTHLTADRARQAFGRGLCVTDDNLIIAGSSPSTISVYRFGERNPLRSVQLTNDVRNAVHGLKVWPY